MFASSDRDYHFYITDTTGDGRLYEHYGIEIIGATAYDPDGAFHLD